MAHQWKARDGDIPEKKELISDNTHPNKIIQFT